MGHLSRIKNLFLKPKSEWLKISTETTPISRLIWPYLIVLCSVPAAAVFIGEILWGRKKTDIQAIITRPNSIQSLILKSLLEYAVNLAAIILFGLVIYKLSRLLQSQPDRRRAMQTAVYGVTPALVSGLFYFHKFASPLGIVGGLYSLYVLALGFLSPLLGTPKKLLFEYVLFSIAPIVLFEIAVRMVLSFLVLLP